MAYKDDSGVVFAVEEDIRPGIILIPHALWAKTIRQECGDVGMVKIVETISARIKIDPVTRKREASTTKQIELYFPQTKSTQIYKIDEIVRLVNVGFFKIKGPKGAK